MTRANRRIASWIALLAIALNAFWPLIAQSEPRPLPVLHELCTLSGVKVIALDDAPGAPVPKASASPHCAFCTLGTGELVVEPSVQLRLTAVPHVAEPVASGHDFPPARFDSLPPAPPRAPPAVS